MSFTRVWPSGVGAMGQVASAALNQLDINVTHCVDGVGGGTYSGALIFTNVTIQGTSNIVSIPTISCQALTVTDTSSLQGDVTCGRDLSVAGETSLVDAYARTLNADKLIPKTIGTQTIDTTTGTVLALDFTLHDSWEITLNNGAGSGTCAVLATTATVTDTTGTPELEVAPMSKFTVLFKAGASQTGGIGIDPAATVFPASFHGITKADLVGPRTGAVTGTGGNNDWMRFELVNVGTAGTPKYDCTVTMGSG